MSLGVCERACERATAVRDLTEEPITCVDCGFTFNYARNYNHHKETKACRNRQVSARASDPSADALSLPCSSCSKTFSSSFVLRAHALIHTHPTERYSYQEMTLELSEFCLERLVREYLLTSSDKVTDLDMLLTTNLCLFERCLSH